MGYLNQNLIKEIFTHIDFFILKVTINGHIKTINNINV
jgi:hypothetical protein